jgi:hypothetical protein
MTPVLAFVRDDGKGGLELCVHPVDKPPVTVPLTYRMGLAIAAKVIAWAREQRPFD